MTFHIKKGDLEPRLEIPISGAKGDVSTASSWRIIAIQFGAVLFIDTSPSVALDPSDPASAVIGHTWAPGQTDTVGDIFLEVEATWPGVPGRPQTFPKRGALKARVHEALG